MRCACTPWPQTKGARRAEERVVAVSAGVGGRERLSAPLQAPSARTQRRWQCCKREGRAREGGGCALEEIRSPVEIDLFGSHWKLAKLQGRQRAAPTRCCC